MDAVWRIAAGVCRLHQVEPHRPRVTSVQSVAVFLSITFLCAMWMIFRLTAWERRDVFRARPSRLCSYSSRIRSASRVPSRITSSRCAAPKMQRCYFLVFSSLFFHHRSFSVSLFTHVQALNALNKAPQPQASSQTSSAVGFATQIIASAV